LPQAPLEQQSILFDRQAFYGRDDVVKLRILFQGKAQFLRFGGSQLTRDPPGQ
jgi:hypothetical protein